MKTSIILRIAFKNLLSHKMRTFITITGVTIGIGSIIFLVSLGYGLERLVTSQVANFNAFTVIEIPSASVSTTRIDQTTVEKIKKIGHIKNVLPVANLAGRIKKPEGSSSVETVINGASEDYWKLSDTSADRGRLPKAENEVVLNQSVLNLIGESSGSIYNKSVTLDLIIPAYLVSKPEESLKLSENNEVKVVGIINDDTSPIVLIHPDLLQKNGAVNFSSLKVKIDDKKNVDVVRKQIENIGFITEYVGDTVNQIAQVFSLFRGILALFGLVALVVAALGSFNTLTISLLERIREIGLLKALGMKNKDVYKLFIFESLIIGFLGGILGAVLGVSLGNLINCVLATLAQKAGVDEIKIFITPMFFSLGVALFSLVVGFLTGWYPSKRAVKINPLDALRYE